MANIYVDSTSAAGGDGTTWTLAWDTIGAAFAGAVAGDTIWVAHTHAESTAGAVTWGDPKGTAADPVRIICVNKAGSVPPVAADLATTATVSTTGANALSLGATGGRSLYIYGITFSSATSGGTNLTLFSGAGGEYVFEQCALRLGGTGGAIGLGGSTTGMRLKNCTFQIGGTGGQLQPLSNFIWDGGSITGSIFSTTLTTMSGVFSGTRIFRNFDFSGMTSGKISPFPGGKQLRSFA